MMSPSTFWLGGLVPPSPCGGAHAPNVAKIEESPTATLILFSRAIRPPWNVNVGNKCIPLTTPYSPGPSDHSKFCCTVITMDQLWAEALLFICKRHARALCSVVDGQGFNTASAFISAVMLTSTLSGLWCDPVIFQDCHIPMFRQNSNAARASKGLWWRFLFWGYGIALAFPTGLWCHPLASRSAGLFCQSRCISWYDLVFLVYRLLLFHSAHSA